MIQFHSFRIILVYVVIKSLFLPPNVKFPMCQCLSLRFLFCFTNSFHMPLMLISVECIINQFLQVEFFLLFLPLNIFGMSLFFHLNLLCGRHVHGWRSEVKVGVFLNWLSSYFLIFNSFQNYLFQFMCMHVLPVSMYVHHLDAWCPAKLKRELQRL